MVLGFRDWLGRSVAAIEDRLSVSQQIGLAVVALCLGLVVVLAGAAAFVSRQQTAKLISGHMSQLAQSMATQLDVGMYDYYREIRNFVQIEAMVEVWTSSPPKMRDVLRQIQAARPEYTWIGFATPNGTVQAATRGLLEGVSVAEHLWFQRAFSGSAVEDVHEAKALATLLADDGSNEPFRFVDVAFPVKTPDGRIAGVLGAYLSWQWASALRRAVLRTMAAPEDTDIWILSRDGTVLLGDATGTRPYSDAVLDLIRTSKHGAFVDSTQSRAMLTGYAVTSGLADYPGLEWAVIARQPERFAFAEARELAWSIARLGLIIALIGIGVAILIARRISRPILALTDEADRIGRDPNAMQLPRQRGSDEVIRLSRALRSLLRRVGIAQQQTQQADLRTAENAAQFAHDIHALRKLADTDPLTNLMNRRAFLAAGHDALEYFRRYMRPIGLLIIDIDHFKRVNDTAGHAAGDAVIRRVGEIIEDVTRSTDKVARFGGEEFVVLLREVDEMSTRASAERLRVAVEGAAIGYGGESIRVTVSIGAALAHTADRDVEDTIARADRGLYMAKNTGRNRCVYMPMSERSDDRQAV